MRNIASLLCACLIVMLSSGCASTPAPSSTLEVNIANSGDYATFCQKLLDPSCGASDAQRLHALFDSHWLYEMQLWPETATYEGYKQWNDRWTDLSPEAELQWETCHALTLQVLNSISRNTLSEEDRLSYDLFAWKRKVSGESHRLGAGYLLVNQLEGLQQTIPNVMSQMPSGTSGDYENALSRLRGIPTYVAQTAVVLREGLKKGITPPKITLRDVPQQVQNLLVEDPMTSPLLVLFTQFPETFSNEQKEGFRKQAVDLYTQCAVPALREFHRFLTEEYIPGSRESIAANDLPSGKEYYALQVMNHTTTDWTPDQIHELGLSEVRRIRAEMEKIKEQTGFKGSLLDFFNFLRTDEQFFHKDAHSLLQGYRDIAKRIDPKMIELFATLPRTPYGVIPIPSYAEQSQTTAYYMSGEYRAGRPGYFYANTYNLKSRPKWEMVPLTLHEAVPGHHHQIAIAQELDHLPTFRAKGWFTAYGEGWALYAESLGEEMGMYTDPYDKMGELTYDMWRAIRLVVDTGIHAKGWTRQQAIDFFKENSPKTEHDITVEVDRYIVWPGQALAYKIGQLKIKELRAYAIKELGEKFDLRHFHDELLLHGCVPMNTLETIIRAWVKKQKGK